MKEFFFLIFAFLSFQISSQDLNDRIYPKEGDSIICKITLVKTNWIYYDHRGKKDIRNDYIHMSDLKFYLYNGIKRRAYEYEEKVIQIDSSQYDISPKDTVKTFYLDSLNKKQTCFIIINKSKKLREINQFRKIKIIDSVGKLKILFPNQISGYWLNGLFYRSFKTNYEGKNILFFAEQLTMGKATLYLYNGEQLNNKSVYIFKKQSENNYHFVLEGISGKDPLPTTEIFEPASNGSTFDRGYLFGNSEQPYLEYFKSYFSDCTNVIVKFKSNWYSYNNVKTMFMDYNECEKK